MRCSAHKDVCGLGKSKELAEEVEEMSFSLHWSIYLSTTLGHFPCGRELKIIR